MIVGFFCRSDYFSIDFFVLLNLESWNLSNELIVALKVINVDQWDQNKFSVTK